MVRSCPSNRKEIVMSEAGTKSPTIVQKLEGFGEEALQDIESFFADLVEAELPVAKQLVAAEIASIPADLIASKPLVAAAQVGQQALATAQAQAIQVGV